MLDYVKSLLHCENGSYKRKVRKTSHFLIVLSKPASKPNINFMSSISTFHKDMSLKNRFFSPRNAIRICFPKRKYRSFTKQSFVWAGDWTHQRGTRYVLNGAGCSERPRGLLPFLVSFPLTCGRRGLWDLFWLQHLCIRQPERFKYSQALLHPQSIPGLQAR